MTLQTQRPADDTFYHLLNIRPIRSWLWLAAFGLIALVILLWAVFGKVVVAVDAVAQIQGSDAVLTELAPDQMAHVSVGQSVYICEPVLPGIITAVQGTVITARLESPSLAEACSARIVIQEFRPIQRLLP